jgi:hypothetical protein
VSSFAAPTVYVAVDTALLADATLMAVLVLAPRGIYAEGKVPQGHPVDDAADVNRVGFISIGGSVNRHLDQFDADGSDGDLTIYVRATSKRTALLIARHVHRILDGKPLPGAVMNPDSEADFDRTVRLIDDYHDDTGAHNAVLRYSTLTVSTA